MEGLDHCGFDARMGLSWGSTAAGNARVEFAFIRASVRERGETSKQPDDGSGAREGVNDELPERFAGRQRTDSQRRPLRHVLEAYETLESRDLRKHAREPQRVRRPPKDGRPGLRGSTFRNASLEFRSSRLAPEVLLHSSRGDAAARNEAALQLQRSLARRFGVCPGV